MDIDTTPDGENHANESTEKKEPEKKEPGTKHKDPEEVAKKDAAKKKAHARYMRYYRSVHECRDLNTFDFDHLAYCILLNKIYVS